MKFVILIFAVGVSVLTKSLLGIEDVSDKQFYIAISGLWVMFILGRAYSDTDKGRGR